jgi:O-acetylhomoserine/O-acetylserine sulfhydrylase-like pyridoxal-dependent enzyme
MRLVLDARTALLLLQHMSTIVNSICRDCDKRDAIADELEHLDLIKDVPYEIVEEDKDEDSK